MTEENSMTFRFFHFGTATSSSWLWNSFLVPSLFSSIIGSLSSSNKHVSSSDKTVIGLCFWTSVSSSSPEIFSASTIFSATNVFAGASSWIGSVSLLSNYKYLLSMSLRCCLDSKSSFAGFETSSNLILSSSLTFIFCLRFLIKVCPLTACFLWDCPSWLFWKPDQKRKYSQVFPLLYKTLLIMSLISPWWKMDRLV